MARARKSLRERREPVMGALLPRPGQDSGTKAASRGAASAPDAAVRRSGARKGKSPGSKPSSAKGKRHKGGRGGSKLGRFLYWSAVMAVWAVIGVAGLFAWVAMHLPPIHALEIPKRPPTVQIVGLDGSRLTTRGEMGGSALSIREMPAYLPKAFIAIEDRRFYAHFGIDLAGLARAVVANALHRGISQGGSTITQQLAKNLFLTPDRTLMRKLEEVVLALWLEHKLTKQQILDLYLNRIYFGAGAYGVEGAAQRYFDKSARQVTLAEAALLAGLVKAPSRLMPTKNYDGAEKRAQLVLAAMAEEGFITEQNAKAAMKSPPRVTRSGGGSADYAADWVMDVLNDVVGQFDSDLVVETTLDPVMQTAAEHAIAETLAERGERYGVEQGALVAMTPDGAVRALVGGRDYRESPFNRAVTAKRQPGSAFKPFVFLTAIERGLTPDTVREDKPIVLKKWRPENYKREYHGPVPLAHALAHSLNTVAIRLTLEFGPTAVARTAHRLGIVSKLEPNASLALGTSEVSLLELVTAYAPFANGGFGAFPHVVERVRTTGGKVLYARSRDTINRLVDPTYIAMMNQMMRETTRIGTARRADLPGWPVAGKTGTSQDFRDAWFIGYSSRMLAGVWFGNDDASPTKKLTGGGLPVEAWSRFMKVAHRGMAVAALPGYSAAPPPPLRPAPPAYASAPASAPAGHTGSVRPVPIQPGMDGWFLDRLFPRR
ncbi:MAG: PBP1A family penicillin-binding protein [Xanthobacteraceae bacterium]